MPSEYVSQPGDPFDVRVAWGSREDEVQVATVCQGVPTGARRVVDYVNEWLVAADMPQVDYDEMCDKLKQSPDFSGWHVGLKDRRRVNDLIFLLRRARDGAFGKDA